MFIGISIFLVLIFMGGLIAFLGDKIGSKVGKKRMTLFRAAPQIHLRDRDHHFRYADFLHDHRRSGGGQRNVRSLFSA